MEQTDVKSVFAAKDEAGQTEQDAHTQQADSHQTQWLADLKLTFDSPTQQPSMATTDAHDGLNLAPKTRLGKREQLGPLSVQRPFYPENHGACHVYLLHPPGGVVGGDHLHIQIETKPHAHALITTPGATKFYRHNGQSSAQVQTLTARSHSLLEWLPQENIFFNDAKVNLTTQIHLEADALFLGWEMHCFGRPALKECFTLGRLSGTTQIFDTSDRQLGEKKLLLTENIHLIGDDDLMRAVGLQGFQMLGSFYITQKNPQDFELVQKLLEEIQTQTKRTDLVIGCTLIGRLIVVRAWSDWSEPMQHAFCHIWQQVRKAWFDEEPELPRIWAT
ncbi:MAG: urease accessory protein UreD [Vibrio sp.]